MSDSMHDLEARLAQLQARLDAMEGKENVVEQTMNRRRALRTAAAAAGIGLATLMVPGRAAHAATGDPMNMGELNSADTDDSTIASHSGTGTFVAKNTSSGIDMSFEGTGRYRQNDSFTYTGGAPTFTPTTGFFETVRDSNGVMWLQGVTASGGTWRRANSVQPITPVRVWDSRNAGGSPGGADPSVVPGAVAGPIVDQQTVTLTLGGQKGLPSAVSGLVLVVTTVTPTGVGFATIWPTGVARPLASSGNWNAGELKNFYPTVASGVAGANAGKISIFTETPGATVHYVMDVAGYLV